MMRRDGKLLIETTSGQEVCAAASFAKSTGASCGCAGTAAMSGSTGLSFSVGGNGFEEKWLAWRSAFGLAIAGGLIPTAAAAVAESEPGNGGGGTGNGGGGNRTGNSGGGNRTGTGWRM
jgi:hypothetical protein